MTTPPAAPGKGFAEIGAALGTVAAIGDRIAIGADRVIVAAEPRQHRRQHAPATAIGRIFLQMRLDLRHQIIERLRWRPARGALRQRKIAEPRRAKRKVERDRHDRQPDQRQNRRPSGASWILDATGGPRSLIGRRQQAAADLDPRGVRFGRADQPRGDIAVDLGKLILVDVRLAAIRLAAGRAGPTARARRRSPRPSSARTQTTASSSGSRVERRPGGTDAPLYTTGGKPGN